MTVKVKELSEEDLESYLDKLRSAAPARTVKPKKAKKIKEATVGEDAIQTALAAALLMEGKK